MAEMELGMSWDQSRHQEADGDLSSGGLREGIRWSISDFI